MSSHENKEWFQKFATALVIDGNSDENQLIHIAEIKNEEVVKCESEIEMSVARASLLLSRLGLTDHQKMKILLVTYFIDRESWHQMFNEENFIQHLSGADFEVNGQFILKLYVRETEQRIEAVLVNDEMRVFRTFVMEKSHIPQFFLSKHISALHHQLRMCFQPFVSALLNGKRPRCKPSVMSKPVACSVVRTTEEQEPRTKKNEVFHFF